MGRSSRLLIAVVLGFVLTLGFALLAVGEDSNDGTKLAATGGTYAAAPASPPSSVDPPIANTTRAEAADCKDLVLPRDEEVNTSLDPHNRRLELSFGERSVVIDYEDPACTQNPTVGPKIREARQTYEEGLQTICLSLRERLARGDTSGRGGRAFDPEAGQAYVNEYCR